MRFADPWVLALLVLPVVALLLRRRGREGAVAFSATGLLAGAPRTRRARWAGRLPWLEAAGLACLVLALARPQWPEGRDDVRLQSRNVIVALDISSSMKATDFQPGNRVEVARTVLKDFVTRREGDLVGLVIFSGKAFLQAPLTHDVRLLGRLLDDVDIGLLPDGTAIGTAIATGLNQLKQLPPAASCIVLITDGANNTGKPTLPEAIEMARALGVRVHAIGLTSADTGEVALNGVWTVRSTAARLSAGDEATLRRVADRTGGSFARATSPAAIDSLLRQVDKLERRDVTIREVRRWRELFPGLVLLGVLCLGAARLLEATWLRRVP